MVWVYVCFLESNHCSFYRNDYGVRSLESILDMVKVMSFAITEGKVSFTPYKMLRSTAHNYGTDKLTGFLSLHWPGFSFLYHLL